MSTVQTKRAILAMLAVAALGASCGDGEAEPTAGSAGEPTGTVTVLAAASLTEPFEALGERLAAEYPGLDVVFSFGPSSGLAEQVIAGAEADVLTTADPATMGDVVEAGGVEGDPEVFARNTLALAVPAGNPGNVSGLSDLERSELRIAVCEPQVPCGAAATRLLDAAGVDARPDTFTTDVKEAASLLSLGEVDAALVYRTDVVATGDTLETIDVPDAGSVVNDYPVALVADAPNPAGARVVLAAITGAAGRSVLRRAGFLAP